MDARSNPQDRLIAKMGAVLTLVAIAEFIVDGNDLGAVIGGVAVLWLVLVLATRRATRRVDAIIDRLHGPGFAVTDRTIDSHIRNLRGKFARVGAADLIETRAGIGYRLGACAGA